MEITFAVYPTCEKTATPRYQSPISELNASFTLEIGIQFYTKEICKNASLSNVLDVFCQISNNISLVKLKNVPFQS